MNWSTPTNFVIKATSIAFTVATLSMSTASYAASADLKGIRTPNGGVQLFKRMSDVERKALRNVRPAPKEESQKPVSTKVVDTQENKVVDTQKHEAVDAQKNEIVDNQVHINKEPAVSRDSEKVEAESQLLTNELISKLPPAIQQELEKRKDIKVMTVMPTEKYILKDGQFVKQPSDPKTEIKVIRIEKKKVSEEAPEQSQSNFAADSARGKPVNPQSNANKETKITNEETKVASEETKVANEETKVVNEETKVANEETKVVNEETKVVNEETKVASEETKVASEETKVVNEETKVVNDETKVANEETKVANEETKVVNEETKVVNEETNKVADEEAKVEVVADEGADTKNEPADNTSTAVSVNVMSAQKTPEPKTVAKAVIVSETLLLEIEDHFKAGRAGALTNPRTDEYLNKLAEAFRDIYNRLEDKGNVPALDTKQSVSLKGSVIPDFALQGKKGVFQKDQPSAFVNYPIVRGALAQNTEIAALSMLINVQIDRGYFQSHWDRCTTSPLQITMANTGNASGWSTYADPKGKNSAKLEECLVNTQSVFANQLGGSLRVVGQHKPEMIEAIVLLAVQGEARGSGYLLTLAKTTKSDKLSELFDKPAANTGKQITDADFLLHQ